MHFSYFHTQCFGSETTEKKMGGCMFFVAFFAIFIAIYMVIFLTNTFGFIFC